MTEEVPEVSALDRAARVREVVEDLRALLAAAVDAESRAFSPPGTRHDAGITDEAGEAGASEGRTADGG